MLPPDLAAFTFSLDRAGTDAAIAARAALVIGQGRVVVAGAQRRSLVVALADRGLSVIAFDAARGALPRALAAAERAGVSARVTLFAADPRDFDVPGGCDAAVVPTSSWRVLTHGSSRAAMLACFRRALRPGGVLLVDADRVPGVAPSDDAPLREGPGRQRWTWRRSETSGALIVTCTAPGVASTSVEIHDLAPEQTADEIRAAGFDVTSMTNAADRGPCTPASRRAWIVAVKPPDSVGQRS